MLRAAAACEDGATRPCRSGAMDIFTRVVSPALDGRRVVGAACGRYHTAAITSDGGVYTFGLNDRGQLGRRGTMGRASTNKCICDSAGECGCGVNGATVEVPVGASCFGGGACRSGVAAEVLSGALSEVSNARAIAVAAGRYSTAVVLQSGEVVTWGLNLCGAERGVTASSLLNDPAIAAEPRLVRLPGKNDADDEGGSGDGGGGGGDKAEVVALGYVHMAVLTASGAVYTCDTGFDGYASGLGQGHAPNRDKQLGGACVQAELGVLTDEWKGVRFQLVYHLRR